jgi:hypothetical protein
MEMPKLRKTIRQKYLESFTTAVLYIFILPNAAGNNGEEIGYVLSGRINLP